MQKKIRTDINALKAVAILAVVFYHLSDLLKSANLSNSTVIDGGFLGVDIFLFISGYLICKTITDRLYCDSFSLRDFYLRRFFRILPPLIFVCIFTLVAGYFLLVPDVFLELNREIANALLFTGNFRFANSGGYFALDSSDRLLLHTWYLSLTIQFYLICPLLLMVAFKASRKLYPYTVLGIFAGTFVLSAFLSVNSKAYLLTQCRIFELFAGAAIYCFNDRLTSFFKKQSSLIKTACVTVLFAIIIAGFFFTRLQGGIYTPFYSLPTIVCTALVILLNYELTIFGTKPVSYTGTISYSLYLWHWPVLVFALRCGLLDSTLSIITLLLCIYLISVLSYSFTEKRQFKIRTVVILYLVLLCAYAFFKKTDGHNYISSYIRDNGSWSQNTVVPREQNLTMSIFSDDKTMPVYHYGRQDVKPDVFIIGDSHADHYSFYFRNVNTYPVYMSALHATMAYGPVFDSMKKARLTGPELRHKYYQTYRKMLATLDRGSKVILANRWDVGYEQYIFEYDLEDNTDNFKNYLKVLLDDISSCTSLYKDLEFYIVGQGVITSSVVVNCLKTDLKGSVLSYIIDASACANTPDYQGERLELINSALREFARRNDNVHFIDRNIPQSLGNRLYRTFTPDDNPLYYDDNHYTNAGGIFIGSYIMECVADKKY